MCYLENQKTVFIYFECRQNKKLVVDIFLIAENSKQSIEKHS